MVKKVRAYRVTDLTHSNKLKVLIRRRAFIPIAPIVVRRIFIKKYLKFEPDLSFSTKQLNSLYEYKNVYECKYTMLL